MTRPEDERRDRTLELPIQEGPIVGTAPVAPPPTAILRPPPPPGVAPGRGSVLLFAGFAAVALIVLAVGVIAGFSLRTGTPQAEPPPAPPPSPTPAAAPSVAPPDTPRHAAEQFLAAAVTADEAAVQERLCTLLRGGGEASDSGGQLWWLSTLVGYKVGEERITGPAATVDVELTVPFMGALAFDLYLLREDNTWRVCGVGPDSA